MRLFAFLLIVIAVVSILGCSAENPICSTNFCAIGEVFPRSELSEGVSARVRLRAHGIYCHQRFISIRYRGDATEMSSPLED